MYDDDGDSFFEMLLGIVFLGPMLLCLWIKFTGMLLSFVFHIVAGIIMVVGYVIKEIFGWLKKLWEK